MDSIKILKRIKNGTGFLLGIYLLMVIQGCAAPVLVGVMYAASALSLGALGSRIYHMSTGGTVEVAFGETALTAEDRKRLASLERIAVAPGSAKSVKLAEALAKSGYSIITPHRVQKVLSQSTQFNNLQLMTESEKIQEASKLCRSLKADALLYYSESLPGAEHRSLVDTYLGKKIEMKTAFEVLLISPDKERILWRQKGEIVIKGANKLTAADEIDQAVVSALTEQFLAVSGKAKT